MINKRERDLRKNKMTCRPKVAVIGGGIHGLTSAIAIAKKGAEVTLIERHEELLSGTSGATHNRAHVGYHYPRSLETALECRDGLSFFRKNFPSALFYPEEAYYLVAKEGSKTSADEFEKFCKQADIPYERVMPSSSLCHLNKLDGSFKVIEPVFDIRTLRNLLMKNAKELGVDVHTDTKVVGSDISHMRYNLYARNSSSMFKLPAEVVVNATYAHANNTLKLLGIEDSWTKYVLQRTEVAVVKSEENLPALTIMDGKFVSIMPLANSENRFLFYDVLNSVLRCDEGFFVEDNAKRESNFKKMIEHGDVYFPFSRKLIYEQSLYGTRPIRMGIAGDSRATRLVRSKSNPPVYSILEGKFISAPLIAENLVKKMSSEGVL